MAEIFKEEQDDEPMPTVMCKMCGTIHTVPECKWSTAPDMRISLV